MALAVNAVNFNNNERDYVFGLDVFTLSASIRKCCCSLLAGSYKLNEGVDGVQVLSVANSHCPYFMRRD